MINRTVLQGRLCADPELRRTNSDIPVASFRVAWSEKYKETETKCFLPCSAWRNTGEFVSKYFHKGQEIVVEGQLSTREYKDRDGNNRSVLELTVEKAHFCGPKASGSAPAAPPPDNPPPDTGFYDLPPEEDDELPF